MRTKYFYYFQDLRVLRCHWTKRSIHVNYRLKWPLQKTFSSLPPPPPAWISRVFDPPSCENFQNPIRRGKCGFFLEQPNVKIFSTKFEGWCKYFSPIKLVSLRKLAPSRNIVCTGTSSVRMAKDFVTEISFCKTPAVNEKRLVFRGWKSAVYTGSNVLS